MVSIGGKGADSGFNNYHLGLCTALCQPEMTHSHYFAASYFQIYENRKMLEIMEPLGTLLRCDGGFWVYVYRINDEFFTQVMGDPKRWLLFVVFLSCEQLC